MNLKRFVPKASNRVLSLVVAAIVVALLIWMGLSEDIATDVDETVAEGEDWLKRGSAKWPTVTGE